MSYLQINHKFNESLTIMHFVHVYRPCEKKEITGVRTSLPGSGIPFVTFH